MKNLITKMVSIWSKNIENCFAKAKDITPFVIAYNTYQDDERGAVDCIFNIDDKVDLMTCVGGGLTANEIYHLVNNFTSIPNYSAYFFFGCNYPNPKQLTTTELKNQLIGWGEDIVTYLINNPHSVTKEVYDAVIGQCLTDDSDTNIISKDGTTIYVVVQHIVEDCDELTLESKPFLKKEEALAYFNAISDEELLRSTQNGWIIETNTNYEFCAHEDGYYGHNHSFAKIEEHIIM